MKKTPKSAKEINELIDAVETDIVTLVKSVKEEMLTKVAPGEETSSETPKDDSASAPPEASASPEAPTPEASPEAPPAEGDPAMAGAEVPPTHEELVQAYSQLPPEQLEEHWLAISEVKGSMGQAPAAPVAPEASMAPAAPVAPAAPAAPPAPDLTMKSEMIHFGELLNKAEKGLSDKDAEIAKLRKELGSVGEKLQKQEADLAAATATVSTFLRRPDRRAITDAPALEKSTTDEVSTLTKSEITSRLRQACRRPDLTTADRKAIDNFIFTGEGLDKIRSFIVGA